MSKQKIISQNDYLKAMKPFEIYIREADHILRTDEYIIIHLDGVGMTKNVLGKLNDEDRKSFSNCLLNVTKALCNDFKSIRLAYACNDEISLLLDGGENEDNYNNRIQKLSSISAAKASTELLRQIQSLGNKNFKNLQSNCIFAVKCYNLPKSLVNDYFKTRLLSCKKSIFDKHQNFESKEDWEKFGYLITYQSAKWGSVSVDFADKKLVKQPQNEYYSLNS